MTCLLLRLTGPVPLLLLTLPPFPFSVRTQPLRELQLLDPLPVLLVRGQVLLLPPSVLVVQRLLNLRAEVIRHGGRNHKCTLLVPPPTPVSTLPLDI